jgi:fluoride exporter
VSPVVWLGVAALGGTGAVLRFFVDGRDASRTRSGFPFGTLAVNLSGAGVLGLVSGLALHPDAALLGGTALVGSYTTFSTWMFETQRLGEERQVVFASANLVLSLVLGVAAAELGRLLGGML